MTACGGYPRGPRLVRRGKTCKPLLFRKFLRACWLPQANGVPARVGKALPGSERACSAKPIAGTGPRAPGAIGRVGKLAPVDRKTTASDALREAGSEAPKLGDPLVDPSGPVAGEARPILARGSAIGRKLAELTADLLKGQSDPLGEYDKGDPAQSRPGKASMARARALRGDQPPLLVEPQRRGCDAAAP